MDFNINGLQIDSQKLDFETVRVQEIESDKSLCEETERGSASNLPSNTITPVKFEIRNVPDNTADRLVSAV